MFSDIERISLFELHEKIYDMLCLGENRETFLKIADTLEFEYEINAYGTPCLLRGDGRRGGPFNSLFGWVTEDIFTLILLNARENMFLVSSDGKVLRASSLFLERLTLYESHSLTITFTERNGGHKWLFFEYPTYILSMKKWDGFGREFLLKNHLIDVSYVLPIAERVRQFEGWSLCLDRTCMPTNISALLDIVKEQQQEGTLRVGRPRLEKAYEAFRQMGFDKGELSWGQLQNLIERSTGERPAPKTFRDWANQNRIKNG